MSRPISRASADRPSDLRCSCHRLLARRTDAGIDLRCPRCKSHLLLSWLQLATLEMGEGYIELEAAE